jgi:asparagine synthetase B (glutamine-hydrolysing)
MCGFVVSKGGRGNSRFIARRGMDDFGTLERDGLRFEHFLLHITGARTPQPFIDGDVVAVYNGEIYNHPFTRSDGENILPLYGMLGAQQLATHLDGEFAIAIYDFERDAAHFITDRFATKPLWRNGIECASYESGVGGHKVPANTVETVRLSTGEVLERRKYHEWNWTQHVDSYEECIRAFVAAVTKRYRPGCFIGMSSGYDSGAIACALRDRDFKAYTVVASENRDIIMQRKAILPDVEVIDSFDSHSQRKHLRENAEDFNYRIRYDSGLSVTSYKDDWASLAQSHICSLAHDEGRKVYLSGTGADEILSDYSLIPRQSEFKGRFPEHLREWTNFTDSCMYSYIGKEECTGGSWSIETRYPFLDSAFVQSYLSLTAELKNRNYKAPLYEYLTRERFPFQANRKIGFSPRK